MTSREFHEALIADCRSAFGADIVGQVTNAFLPLGVRAEVDPTRDLGDLSVRVALRLTGDAAQLAAVAVALLAVPAITVDQLYEGGGYGSWVRYLALFAAGHEVTLAGIKQRWQIENIHPVWMPPILHAVRLMTPLHD